MINFIKFNCMFNLRNYNNDIIFIFSESIIYVWVIYKFVFVFKEVLFYNRKSIGIVIKIFDFKFGVSYVILRNFLFFVIVIFFVFKMGVILVFFFFYRVVKF